MTRFGSSPFLECSSKGDRRFSAFFARPRSLQGRSIEEAYQAMKIFPDGRTGLSWREAKGQQATNISACRSAYDLWWREWVKQQHLRSILSHASGLSDIFGQPGCTNQAETLWNIRNSFRCIIAGSRTVSSLPLVCQAILNSDWLPYITELVSGCARGVDTIGEEWALGCSPPIPIVRFPADWASHGRSAGFLRNVLMADYSDGLIAVWDGLSPGTSHMIRTATAKGLEVYVEKV